MERRGLENAYQLAAFAGLTKPLASRLLAGAPLERIDVATLEALARAFRVKPWALLEYVPDDSAPSPACHRGSSGRHASDPRRR
jgi:transcriptional regulator with XRE-family HTH domain